MQLALLTEHAQWALDTEGERASGPWPVVLRGRRLRRSAPPLAETAVVL